MNHCTAFNDRYYVFFYFSILRNKIIVLVLLELVVSRLFDIEYK